MKVLILKKKENTEENREKKHTLQRRLSLWHPTLCGLVLPPDTTRCKTHTNHKQKSHRNKIRWLLIIVVFISFGRLLLKQVRTEDIKKLSRGFAKESLHHK